MADFAAMIGQAALTATQPGQLDLAGSLQRGAALAIQKEQLEAEKIKLSQAKQTAQAAAHEKFMNAVQKIPSFKGTARSNYVKNLKAYRDALGLTAEFSDDSLEFITASDENIARMQTLRARVRDPHDPMSAQEAIALMNSSIDFADVPPEVKETFYEDIAGDDKTRIGAETTQTRMAIQQQQFAYGQHAASEREFRSTARQLGSEVRTKFGKVEEGKVGLRNARMALDQIKADMAAGKKPSSIQFNVAARGLAKAFNSGAMSDHDVADFKNLTGFSNIAQDFINKWITGDVNPNSVASLERILTNSAKNMDSKVKVLSGSFDKQFTMMPGREDELRRITGLGEFQSPTFGEGWQRNAFDPSINVDEAGRPLPGAQSAPPQQRPQGQQPESITSLPSDRIKELRDWALDPVTRTYSQRKLEAMAQRFGITVQEIQEVLNGGGE